MDAPAVSLARKMAAAALAFALALSMAPAAWADDGPVGTLAGTVAGNASGTEAPGGDQADAADDGQAPEADLQSADAAAADGGSGGTTISIAVYRSSFPIVKWDLNDDDYGLTKAEWAWVGRTGELPESASPGSEVAWPESGKPADYAEPTRAGFEFAGWSTDGSASAGGFLSASPAITMPEGAPESKSYTLYALWTPLEYAVVFDLAKNPEDGNGPGSDASYALNWESDSGVSRTVTDLGNGRFLVEGFTMDERTYDAATRTVGLPEPSRTGYRFLGWAEPDGQRLAIDNAAKDGFALNPVRLTQIDGTPVLTARWTSAFGVTAPLSVTFGDYDKTGAPGNPWLGDAGSTAGDDTTQSEADDTTKDERSGYEALGQAYFENTGWHEAVKVVALSSERDPSANQVLTTYDSKQASEAAVLGDGTAANPGERLLSLYPSASAPVDKSTGVHFRLSDSLDEDALGSAFTMGAQGSGSERLPITYGLNLSTDPTDNSANHGLVLPTDDYSRKQIATVSYTFATAAAATHDPMHLSPLYISGDGFRYELPYIKAAAEDLAVNGTSSRYYSQFKAFLDSDATFTLVTTSGAAYNARLVGICQDTVTATGRKAGLTFGLKGSFGSPVAFDARTATSWQITYGNCAMKSVLDSDFASVLPQELTAELLGVTKSHRRYAAAYSSTQQYSTETLTNQTLFVPSYNEMFGANSLASDGGTFQYQYYAKGASYRNLGIYWWTRSALVYSVGYGGNYNFYCVSSAGAPAATYGATTHKYSVVPHFCL